MSNPAKFNYSWWYWDSEICSLYYLGVKYAFAKAKSFLKVNFLEVVPDNRKILMFLTGTKSL